MNKQIGTLKTLGYRKDRYTDNPSHDMRETLVKWPLRNLSIVGFIYNRAPQFLWSGNVRLNVNIRPEDIENGLQHCSWTIPHYWGRSRIIFLFIFLCRSWGRIQASKDFDFQLQTIWKCNITTKRVPLFWRSAILKAIGLQSLYSV